MIDRDLLLNVRDQETLVELLQTQEHKGGLGWRVDPDVPFEHEPSIQAGDLHADLYRLIPTSADENRLVLLAEFDAPYKRRELRQLLRAVRHNKRTTARFESHSITDDTIFIVAAPGYADVRFVLFQEQEGRQPRIRSFGWSADQVGRTLLDRNLDSLRWTNRERWEQAWNVEALAEDFFREYRRVFQRVEELVTGVQGDKRLFVQRLFNRLLFIQFLSRKGWLRFNDSTDYLRALWNGRIAGANFYTAHLSALFFAGLNNEQGRNLNRNNPALEALIGQVPFLNGGLFEKAPDEGLGEVVPDEALDLVVNELFARWNFTITESTPLDIDVAVDPEMLGKVFEELVTGRHETGSYYTPRPVVAFMCREALKGYLGGYEKLVDDHDATGIGIAEARDLIQKLEAIKVCDPACGSGAYLLGMLQEIHALQYLLDTTAHQLTARDDHARKLQIIENCLYGVDIDPFAVNIAWLRLWLALVIDDPRNPLEQPDTDVSLPNLDVKIGVGDSLLAPDPRAHQLTLAKALIDTYREQKGAYMRAHTQADKGRLRAEMAHSRTEIRTYMASAPPPEGSFDWAVDFAEVFMDAGAQVSGFDAVLANPPYLSTKHGFGRENRGLLARLYRTAVGQFDAYAVFLERALNLLDGGGCYSFIIPKPVLSNRNMAPVRALLASWTVTSIADPGMTFTANVEPIVIAGQKIAREDAHVRIYARLSTAPCPPAGEAPLSAIVMPTGVWNPGASFSGAPPSPDYGNLATVGSLFRVVRGVECGKRDECISDYPRANAYRVLFGEDVDPYVVRAQPRYIERDGDVKKFKPMSLYRGPKLLVRRVANRLVAAVDHTDYHVLNTLYILHPATEGAPSIEYACAVLNSDLVNRFFNRMYINDDKLFPYIRKEQILAMPMPIPSAEGMRRVEGLVAEVTGLAGSNTGVESHRICQLLARIDDAIEGIFADAEATERSVQYLGSAISR